MKKTHHGSCHCGAVRFEATLDLATADTSRCNCSSCMRSRFWKVLVPAADFRLISGAEMLGDYQFGSLTIHHQFCRTCGVKVFGRAHFDNLPFRDEVLSGDFYAINVACLDATDEEFSAAPVRYEDGRNDAWDKAPADTRFL